MKRFWIPLLCLAVILSLGLLLPVHGEEAVYDSVIRLHVLANSDSAEDQALKLCVRDAVLAYTETLLHQSKDREDATRILSAHLEEIRAVAQKTVTEEGYNDTVSVYLGEESYPTRQYESCCFPSGNYLSLRVCIGEAEGQNWWCVLFPTMCFSAASDNTYHMETELRELGLCGDQYRIITDSENTTYQIRFKLLEVIESLVE